MSLFPNKLLLNIFVCGLVLSCPLYPNGLKNLELGKLAYRNVEKVEHKKQHSDQKDRWTVFTSTHDDFSVELPKKPKRVQQMIDIPKTDLKIVYSTYLSEPSDHVVYVISVWNYPEQIDMSKPEVNLQDGFGGMLSALPGSEVINMQMGDVQGFKALEFLVKNEDIFFQGKLILVHNTLYQVFVVYKNTVDIDEQYARFIHSFTLTNLENRKAPAHTTDAPQKMDV